jgi:hypothetical protein
VNDRPPNEIPPDELDDWYRRASALDTSRPSDSVRRAIIDHAARSAARPAANAGQPKLHGARSWRRTETMGLLAAAALAGFLSAPHFIFDSGRVEPGTPTQAAAPVHRMLAQRAAPAQPAAAPAQPAAAPAPQAAAPAPKPSAAPLAPSVMQYDELAPAAPRAALGVAPAQTAAAGRTEGQTSGFASSIARPGPREQELLRAAAAGDAASVQQLLARHAAIEARDSQGRTALFLAVMHGQAETVNLLLDLGADPNTVDADGHTALNAARIRGYSGIAARLEQAGAHP